jgi:hypothetical protein
LCCARYLLYQRRERGEFLGGVDLAAPGASATALTCVDAADGLEYDALRVVAPDGDGTGARAGAGEGAVRAWRVMELRFPHCSGDGDDGSGSGDAPAAAWPSVYQWSRALRKATRAERGAREVAVGERPAAPPSTSEQRAKAGGGGHLLFDAFLAMARVEDPAHDAAHLSHGVAAQTSAPAAPPHAARPPPRLRGATAAPGVDHFAAQLAAHPDVDAECGSVGAVQPSRGEVRLPHFRTFARRDRFVCALDLKEPTK